MGHRDKVKKLGRTKSHREAMLANMAMSLFTHRVIKTTDAKAKALKPLVDRLIATAKQDTLHAKRMVARTVKNKRVFRKLFGEIAPQFAERDSGFSRVIKLGVRRGDGAALSVVELLVERPPEKEEAKAKKEKKDAKTAAGRPRVTAGPKGTKASKRFSKKTQARKKGGGKQKTAQRTKNK
ncbi:MAG: 50S ribosomal protein L17 [Candidatus Zixiibacteriota bacterium]|nr:MAG: 50S ribosomal protein L17 [candidate division Zixibacteria bacterium]